MSGILPAAVTLLIAGCAGVLPSVGGGPYTHRFALPPERAAQCFARNSEEHSSALTADTRRMENGGMEVLVRVKNGVPYASARISPSGAGATGRIELNVQSSEGNRALIEALTAGC